MTDYGDTDSRLVVKVLTEALPYINRFRDKTIVVKYGGNVLDPKDTNTESKSSLSDFASDIALMTAVGIKVVVVHGGGPQIGEFMTRLGKEPVFVNGLRVTDAETLDIARMVLIGKVNLDIVGAVNKHGPLAVGLSGEDAGLINAEALDPALGFVGDVQGVDTAILHQLLNQNLVPVVATIASDKGGQMYNINADSVAGALAGALGAEKLVLLTDVSGVRSDPRDPDTLIRKLSTAQLNALISSGSVEGGMIPKAKSCMAALENGVRAAHILDGRLPHVLLVELFTEQGVGTMITAAAPSKGNES
ncbi:MAG: acetylglutamate kinase [Firmicutes bacterium]|jgi:acetylglutamate kinase|nr:acetylglutamate kinase [Bacillota bacterium]